MLALTDKIRSIRLLILDVDGILTNGLIYYTDDGKETRAFHVHDGLGIRLLHQLGIQIAIISAKSSPGVLARMRALRIEHLYLGQENKLAAYNELKARLQLLDEEIAYMGDDLPDLPVLSQVGIAITVPNAPQVIQQQVHYVTKKEGGQGAVREVCEWILTAQKQTQSMLESFLSPYTA